MSAAANCSKKSDELTSACRLYASQWTGEEDWVSWVITGFSEVPAGDAITIFGRADVLSLSYDPKSHLNHFYLLSYADHHSSDVFYFGKLIALSRHLVDSQSLRSGIQLQALPLIADTGLARSEFHLLRERHCGPLSFMLRLDHDATCERSSVTILLPSQSDLSPVSGNGF